MPTEARGVPVYWDTSAVISVLVADSHTRQAQRYLVRPMLLSTLALAEALAILARLEREDQIRAGSRGRVAASLFATPWVRYEGQPKRDLLADLATRSHLRGADLWHLATALTAREDLPELEFLTFDRALAIAATAEGLAIAHTI